MTTFLVQHFTGGDAFFTGLTLLMFTTVLARYCDWRRSGGVTLCVIIAVQLADLGPGHAGRNSPRAVSGACEGMAQLCPRRPVAPRQRLFRSEVFPGLWLDTAALLPGRRLRSPSADAGILLCVTGSQRQSVVREIRSRRCCESRETNGFEAVWVEFSSKILALRLIRTYDAL